MKLLIIKPNPNLTDEEREILRKDLRDSVRMGIILEDPDVITHEIVEFDSIEYDNQSLYPKLPKRDRRGEMRKIRELMGARVNEKKGENPQNDNSVHDGNNN